MFLVMLISSCHITYLSACFHIKDHGSLHYFLRLLKFRKMLRHKYTLDIICEMDMSNAKMAATPIEQTHHLAHVYGPLLSNPEKYRQLIG